MFASNKVANYVLLALGLTAFYFGYVYFPIYWDNIEFKQAARVWISSNREEKEQIQERNRRAFDANVRSLGITVQPEACTFTRDANNEGGHVECDYTRDLVFPLVDKRKPIRFHWTVKQRFTNM